MSDEEIRVVLVEDQELVRSGPRRLLRRRDGFSIVAECAAGTALPSALAEHEADVVVMDLRIKHVDGIEANRRLRAGPGDAPPVLHRAPPRDRLCVRPRAGHSAHPRKPLTGDTLVTRRCIGEPHPTSDRG